AGKMLAVGWEDDDTVVLFDTGTNSVLLGLHERGAPVYFLAFAPDGKRLLTSGQDRAVKEWPLVPEGEQPHLKRLPGFSVAAVTCSPDGKTLAVRGTRTVARDVVHEVKLLDAVTGQERAVLGGHKGAIQAVAFAPDGKRLVTGGSDGTLRVWDAL